MCTCRCEYIVESGERYVGEWEAGKPKWVQALGLEGEALPELLPDMQSKVRQALEVRLPSYCIMHSMCFLFWHIKCLPRTRVLLSPHGVTVNYTVYVFV